MCRMLLHLWDFCPDHDLVSACCDTVKWVHCNMHSRQMKTEVEEAERFLVTQIHVLEVFHTLHSCWHHSIVCQFEVVSYMQWLLSSSSPYLNIWVAVDFPLKLSNFSFCHFFFLFVCSYFLFFFLNCRFLKVWGWLRNGRASSLGETTMFLTCSQSESDRWPRIYKEKDGRFSTHLNFQTITKTYRQRCASPAELCDVKPR